MTIPYPLELPIAIRYLGILPLIIGFGFFVWTQFLFDRKGKGTLAPWDAPKKLVISGPYKYSRNPMILAVLIIVGSQALVFQSLSVFIWCLLFFIITTIYFIYQEEPALEQKFGEEYTRYKRTVRRWF